MLAVIRQTVKVQPGGVVSVCSPELEPGAMADVLVRVRDKDRPRRSLTSFIGAGKGLFNSVEEIDAYVRELRDEWER